MDQILANHSAVLGLILLGLIHFGSKGLQIAVLLKQLREKPVAPGVSPADVEARIASHGREQERLLQLNVQILQTQLSGLQRDSTVLLEFMRRLEDRLNDSTPRPQIFNPGGGQ